MVDHFDLLLYHRHALRKMIVLAHFARQFLQLGLSHRLRGLDRLICPAAGCKIR